MNLMIQKNQMPDPANSSTNEEINQCFNALPAFLQENIKQSGVHFNSAQEMQQIANQMLSHGNSQQ